MRLRAILLLLAAPTIAAAQSADPPIVGRWDLTVAAPNGPASSWLEVLPSGNGYLVGRFVGTSGSARPISRVEFSGGALRFAIPPQWENGKADLAVQGTLAGEKLSGTFTMPDGARLTWTGVRAPDLVHATPAWGAPVALFDGKSLTGWAPRGGKNNWSVVNGLLTNAGPGANLVTTGKFGDFKLHAEFRYPKGSNSGIYLRGRYEVQIEDSPHRAVPRSDEVGGVYGYLAPNASAANPPGQWQTYDITLVGRRITVVLNGRTVIADQLVPGITGEAIDSDEAAPGPIFLQGTEGAVEFRRIVLTPGR